MAEPDLISGIDTHIHLYRPQDSVWKNRSAHRLNKPHYAADFSALVAGGPVSQAIIVEAGNAPAHNEWMLEHAREEPAILGVVGNLNLADPESHDTLARLGEDPLFLGIRNRGWGVIDFYSPTAKRNLKQLEALDLVFETTCNERNAGAIVAVAEAFPELRIVINHMASGRLDDDGKPADWWMETIKLLGACPSVYMKLSAYDSVFEHDYAPARLAVLFDSIREHFGPDRLLYGSNWPVTENPEQMISILEAGLSESEPELFRRILLDNPIAAYKRLSKKYIQ